MPNLELPITVITLIASFGKQGEGDHFDSFAVCRLWARALSKTAQNCEKEFEREDQVRTEIELEHEQAEMDRQYESKHEMLGGKYKHSIKVLNRKISWRQMREMG